MIAYIAVIGIISTISCVLIIICLNSKTSQDNFPVDGSSSPFKRQALTQTQKSQLLLIVCVIFFMSLITTNVKTSKFSVMWQNLWPEQDYFKNKYSTIVQEIFYGKKGRCKFGQQVKKYALFQQFLQKIDKKDQFLKGNSLKNYNVSQYFTQLQQNSYQNKQLTIFYSQKDNSGSQIVLPEISSQICTFSSQKTPLIYINLQNPIKSEQQLMDKLKIANYQQFRKNICKLNGIQIKKQVQKIGNYYIERQIYVKAQNKQLKRSKSFIILNNFQNLIDLIITKKTLNLLNQNQNKDDSHESKINQEFKDYNSLFRNYHLFYDLMFNQLIQKCKINVILHTNNKDSVYELYNMWKMTSNSLNNNFMQSNQNINLNLDFPFQIKLWKGLTKIQFYQLIKLNLQNFDNWKEKQNLLWKVFQNHFGAVSLSEKKKINLSASQSSQKIFIQNGEDLSFKQIEKFFQQLQNLQKLTAEDTIKKKELSQKSSILQNQKLRQGISKYNGLEESYAIIKKMIKGINVSGQSGLQIGKVKRKVSLADLNKLEELKLISIKEGRVYLLN